MKRKYWDDTNGRITDDNSYALIYDGGDHYFETYDIDDGRRITIAYTPEQKRTVNLYYYRKHICEENGIELNQLHKLIRLGVPTELYNEIMQEGE